MTPPSKTPMPLLPRMLVPKQQRLLPLSDGSGFGWMCLVAPQDL
jgi:hypothetical protein